MRMSWLVQGLVTKALLFSLTLLLCACGTEPFLDKSSWADRLTIRNGLPPDSLGQKRTERTLQQNRPSGKIFQPGTDVFIERELPALPPAVEQDQQRSTLN